MHPTDLLAAALPKLPVAPARFDPRINTKRDRVVALAKLVGHDRMAVKIINEANPELSARRRVDLAMPARLMWPWTQVCNQPWRGHTRHYDAMEKASAEFKKDIATCLIGFDQKDRVRLWNRIWMSAEEPLNPLLTGPARIRPSNLTGFLTCSFVWQGLVDDGVLELEEGSVFHLAYQGLADLVVQENSLEDLTKARESALRRTGPLLDALKRQGIYS